MQNAEAGQGEALPLPAAEEAQAKRSRSKEESEFAVAPAKRLKGRHPLVMVSLLRSQKVIKQSWERRKQRR